MITIDYKNNFLKQQVNHQNLRNGKIIYIYIYQLLLFENYVKLNPVLNKPTKTSVDLPQFPDYLG